MADFIWNVLFESGTFWLCVALFFLLAEFVVIGAAVADCCHHNEADLEELDVEERAAVIENRRQETLRQRRLFIFAVKNNLLPELYEYNQWKEKRARRQSLKELLFSDAEEEI